MSCKLLEHIHGGQAYLFKGDKQDFSTIYQTAVLHVVKGSSVSSVIVETGGAIYVKGTVGYIEARKHSIVVIQRGGHVGLIQAFDATVTIEHGGSVDQLNDYDSIINNHGYIRSFVTSVPCAT